MRHAICRMLSAAELRPSSKLSQVSQHKKNPLEIGVADEKNVSLGQHDPSAHLTSVGVEVEGRRFQVKTPLGE